MKKILIKKIFVAVNIFCLFLIISFAAANAAPPETNPQELNSKTLLQEAGKTAEYKTDSVSLSGFVGDIVGVFFSLLGIIFVVLMIYAGYNWMTASGDQAKLDKAKDTIWRAIIGLIITVGAYAIWNMVAGLL